jgi:hypothetical protein
MEKYEQLYPGATKMFLDLIQGTSRAPHGTGKNSHKGR